MLTDRVILAAVSLFRKTGAGKKILNRTVSEEIARTTGSHSICDTHPGDIFIVGYPKSGNTWMQNLICGAIYGINPAFAEDSLVQDLVPDVHAKSFFRRYREHMFFKSHSLPRPEYRRVIYLLRDGQDVMVSYHHHLQAARRGSIDFLDMVENGTGLFPCHWHEHVQAWSTNPHQAEILTVRYEDLKSDPHAELERICAFAGELRDHDQLRMAAQNSSFSAMRLKEERSGWDAARNWPRERRFVRRGKVGSYRDEMPTEVRVAFLRQARETLEKFGYLGLSLQSLPALSTVELTETVGHATAG
jgi:hypothetical protein